MQHQLINNELTRSEYASYSKTTNTSRLVFFSVISVFLFPYISRPSSVILIFEILMI